MDERLIVGVLVAAASSWLLVLIVRKILDVIDKSTGGKFYAAGWAKKTGVVLDTLLPFIPCAPSGLLSMLIMNYWPPNDLWDNTLLHFLVGSLAGVVASSIYYTITRGLEKRAERLLTPPDQPSTS